VLLPTDSMLNAGVVVVDPVTEAGGRSSCKVPLGGVCSLNFSEVAFSLDFSLVFACWVSLGCQCFVDLPLVFTVLACWELSVHTSNLRFLPATINLNPDSMLTGTSCEPKP
jgi:hypothetical protein